MARTPSLILFGPGLGERAARSARLDDKPTGRALTDSEARWETVADLVLTMAPDVKAGYEAWLAGVRSGGDG